MDLSYFRELYSYNRWANSKTLAAASNLDPDQFRRPLGSSFSSVRDTLAHILGGEWIWLERWNGRSPKGLLSVADLPDLGAIYARWKQVEEDQNRFLHKLGEPELEKSISYVNQRGETWIYPLWQQMAHVVNHSTYHRGQAATLLRQLGAKAPMTDFLFYYDQRPAR